MQPQENPPTQGQCWASVNDTGPAWSYHEGEVRWADVVNNNTIKDAQGFFSIADVQLLFYTTFYANELHLCESTF